MSSLKSRVMVSIVGVPFLLLVLGWAPSWATMILIAGMCAIGAQELMHAVAGNAGKKLVSLTVLAAVLIPIGIYLEESLRITQGKLSGTPVTEMVALLFVVSLFVVVLWNYERDLAIPFAAVTAAIFGGLVFPLMLSCMLRLRMVESIGNLLVFIPLCISFGSDTMAYFVGCSIGKHKLAPKVSPKKSVEGAAGGLLGGVLGMLLLAVIAANVIRDAFMAPVHILVFGLIGSVISQIGDLSFSVIKREFGVKDYGKLLAGHGGILDRFDSVMVTAPLTEALLLLLPILVK